MRGPRWREETERKWQEESEGDSRSAWLGGSRGEATHLELGRVLDDGNETLELIGVELSGTVRELHQQRRRTITLVLPSSALPCQKRTWVPSPFQPSSSPIPAPLHDTPPLPSASALPLVEVDIGLLADDVRVTPSDSLDLGEGEHDLPLSVNVGVEETRVS